MGVADCATVTARVDQARYVAAFLGARDHYQSAVALAEAGKLQALVTDFYTPDPLARLAGRMPDRFRRKLRARSHPELPSARVKMARLGLSLSDPALGRAAAEVAGRTGSGALVYSYYWPGFAEALAIENPGRRAAPYLVFQVHPVPTQARAILAEDRERSGVAAELDQEELLTASDVERFQEALARADGVIAPSGFVARGLTDLGASPSSVEVVPYGVATPAGGSPIGSPRRAVANAGAGPLRLLWVGQLAYRKAPHVLFAALRLLPSHAVTLTMVCRGRADPVLRALAPDNVSFLDPVEPDRLAHLYRSHDAFVMPSLVEGFGLVYLEAMGHGLPVIATPNTGIADLIDDGVQGRLVAPGDVASCASAIEALLSEPARLPEMSAAAARTASEYTWERFRRRLLGAVLRFEAERPGVR